jgi:hypothetical protein
MTASILCFVALLNSTVAPPPNRRHMQVHVNVNGVEVQFQGHEPSLMGGRMLVPIRGVFERLGATVHWEQGSRQVQIGMASKSTHPVKYLQGRPVIPLRAVGEKLGASVTWDAATATASIKLVERTALNK